MSFLGILGRERRLWLMLLLAVLAVVVSRYSLSSAATMTAVVKGGYWMLLTVFGLFACAVWKLVRDSHRNWRPGRAEGLALGLILACGGILIAHERQGFKILADEVLLAGTSMGIHYDRQIAYPLRATDIQGPFQILQRVLDKRPFFFPFLVSFVHDLTGYRPANAFYVNTALGFVFLGLVFVLGRKLGGSVGAGVLPVLLFAGLPLLSQQMKGGGFELLNLVMIATVLLLALEFAERRSEVALDALCLATVLLAFTRYESVLFLVPVGGLVLWGWWREQRVILTWSVVATPLFLAFYLLQNRVFSINAASWELASQPEATTPFGLHYLSNNLGHALGFFFDTTGYQPNSPFFAAVGLPAAAFLALKIVGILRTLNRAQPAEVALAAVSLGLFGIWALLMVYFWGQFDHPLIRRLSLPVHLLMALAVAAVGGSFLRNRRGWQAAAGAAVLAIVVYSLPVMSRRAYANTYSPAVGMEWRDEFLRRFPERDYLFIDNDATYWIVNELPATPTRQARERKEGLIYHLRNHSFSAMYVFQHFNIDDKTGVKTLSPADDVGPDFELETVWERRIRTLYVGRISRIVAIREGDDVAARAGPVVLAPGPARSETDLENARKDFVDYWMKQLP